MKVKAQISFAGAISMRQGEERELDDESVALQDLLQAGYVVGVDVASVPNGEKQGEGQQGVATAKAAKAAEAAKATKKVASK